MADNPANTTNSARGVLSLVYGMRRTAGVGSGVGSGVGCGSSGSETGAGGISSSTMVKWLESANRHCSLGLAR